ncbi:MAG: hypothetical protein J0H62_02885 [Rhizobiales bacterium]|nr:hypothetical protein [Hyphomicrobiales bacterium]
MTLPIEFTAVSPFIVAVLAAGLGLFTFSYQKRSERRDKSKANADFQKARISLRLFASREVLKCAKLFEDHLTRQNLHNDPNALAANLLNQMRRHTTPHKWFDRDLLTDAEMKEFNSFKVS